MEVIGQETLWEGRFIKTSMIYYKDHNGVERAWEAVSRVNCNGIVIIIPITMNNEVILIRQFRPVLNSYAIELPAGLIDTGEDVLSAGRRELIEETGYTSGNFTLLTWGAMSTGIDTDQWSIVLARDVTKVAVEIQRAHPPDESENIEIVRVPVDMVYETLDSYINRGDTIDLRIPGLLELARRKMNRD
jgi:8-oxo-dGTP pyrophosphatase MutT (NUDIX family)